MRNHHRHGHLACCVLLLIAASLKLYSSCAFSFSIQKKKHASRLTSLSSASSAIDAGSKLSAAAATREEVLQIVQEEHEEEISIGFETFGRPSSSLQQQHFDDSDFIHYTIDPTAAGPDVDVLNTHANVIFQTKRPIVDILECQQLIDEARAFIEQQNSNTSPTTQNQQQPTNSMLGEARVSQLPSALTWLQHTLQERFFPILENCYNIPSNELTLHDALIIGYGCLDNRGGSMSQPIHRDSSILSLNVALSPSTNYQGGGTFFEALDNNNNNSSILHNEQGHVMCHAGGISHAGKGIDSGERWILVLFCLSKHHPQIARRCHARGMRLQQQGILEEAAVSFQAGLSVAPRDHLLHMSLGGVCMAQNHPKDSQLCLMNAALYYKYCGRANLTFGRLLLNNRQPRAALRRFESVLEFLRDRDLQSDCWTPWRAMGWDARVYGAQATIMCAQYAIPNNMKSFDSEPRLQRAREWLDIVSLAAPGDARILEMKDKIKGLLGG